MKAAPAPVLVVCGHCQQWESTPDDLHCSFCGHILLPLEVEPQAFTLISTLAAQKEITLRNAGSRPLNVTLAASADGTLAALSIDPAGPLSILPNGQIRARFTVDDAQLPAGFRERTIEYACIVDDDGRKRVPLRVTVRGGPRPRVQDVDFGSVEEGQIADASIDIVNAGGTPLRIARIEPQGSPHLRLKERFTETVLQPGDKIAVAVQCEGHPGEEAAEGRGFLLQFANFPQSMFIAAKARTFRQLVAFNPDAVRFARALSKQDHAATVRLENHGTTDVEITGIETDHPWLSVVSRSSTFTLLCAQSASQRSGPLPPTTFARQCDLKIVCRPQQLDAGKHRGEVTVRVHGQRPLILPVEIQVVRPRDYPDYIGIDFGTTNSVVAVLSASRELELVDDELSHSHLIPSVLVFDDADTYKIGQAARNEADLAPDRTVRSIKRIMGYEHERQFFDRTFSAGELASLIIRRLVQLAEQKLYRDGDTYYSIGKAIITVPANFFDLQIREVLEACRMAGLDIEEERARRAAQAVQEKIGKAVNAGIILDEPSAAVLYYIDYLRRHRNASEIMQAIDRDRGLNLLVFDYGGGTLDVSLASITREGAGTGLRIMANVGDNGIGGDSIDLILMKELLTRCADKSPEFDFDASLIAGNFKELAARGDREGWSGSIWKELLRVRGAWKDLAEAAKLRLAAAEQTDVEIRPDLIIKLGGGKIQSAARGVKLAHVKRTTFDDLLQPVLKKCTQLIESALDLAHIQPADIDYILHTGRQSLLPTIRQHVRELFPHLKADRDLLEEEHLKVCVAKGAALYGSMRGRLVDERARIHFLDEGRSLPHSYGVEAFRNPLEPEFDVIIPRGSKYPVEKARHYGPEMILDSGYLNLRFYQNTGTSTAIVRNPQVSLIGEISIDTIADGKPGCDVRFVIGANRTLEVFADDAAVVIQRASLRDEEGWMG